MVPRCGASASHFRSWIAVGGFSAGAPAPWNITNDDVLITAERQSIATHAPLPQFQQPAKVRSDRLSWRIELPERTAETTDIFEIMHTMRAMRRLKPDPVPDELIRKILLAGQAAANGGNTQR